MFVYAPVRPKQVAEAIEREGGKAYIVTVAEGTALSTAYLAYFISRILTPGLSITLESG